MDMEGIFQELILSVGLSVAVWYMIMKLQSNGDGGGVEDYLPGEQGLAYDICGSKIRPWPFAEFLDKHSVEDIYENDVLCRGEISNQVVVMKRVEALQDSSKAKCMVEQVVDGSRTKDEAADVSCQGSNSLEIEVALPEEEEAAERPRFEEIESEDVEVVKDNLVEVSGIHSPDGNERMDAMKKDEDEEQRLFGDWEGIERTELEKLFGAAVAFVGSKSNASACGISRDLKIQLHGLHKVAIEGPCRGTRPMPLKLSARAKWNSWRSLGNMNREVAMEQYLILLSQTIPDWTINTTLQCCPPGS